MENEVKGKHCLELKIVGSSLNDVRILIEKYRSEGFVNDGKVQIDNGIYWTFSTKNEGLVND